jgi:hypothetical protein
VSAEHLDDYLNEFTFRFNRRTSASRGKLFCRLTQQAVQTEPAPFAKLVKTATGWGWWRQVNSWISNFREFLILN